MTPSVASKFEVEDNGRNFIAGCRASIRRGLIRQRVAVQARREFVFATRPIHYHSPCCIYVGVFSCLVEQRFRYRTMNALPWHESSSRNDVDRLTAVFLKTSYHSDFVSRVIHLCARAFDVRSALKTSNMRANVKKQTNME